MCPLLIYMTIIVIFIGFGKVGKIKIAIYWYAGMLGTRPGEKIGKNIQETGK